MMFAVPRAPVTVPTMNAWEFHAMRVCYAEYQMALFHG